MNYELPMPSLGSDMDEGKILEWRVKVGDTVKKNQIIAEVETTKAAIEIESFREGIVTDLLAKGGDVIPVGKTIAILDVVGEEILDKPKSEIKKEVIEDQRLRISPAARKMAEENHVDISLVKGSGAGGEITLKDIEDNMHLKTQKAFAGVNLREAISSLMSRSKKEIPHYYLKKRIHLDFLMNWLDETNRKLDPSDRILLPSMLMRAVVLALKKFPEMNGFYKENKFQASSNINLGIAFSVKNGGVIAPAVLEAEKMNYNDFNKAIQNLALRSREGGLKSREMSEGTITITNVGDLGSDEVYGIIFPPQVAIVGLGHIRKEAVVDAQEQIRSGFVVDITLSADHRVSDGLLGARFLNEIEKKLQVEPGEHKDEY